MDVLCFFLGSNLLILHIFDTFIYSYAVPISNRLQTFFDMVFASSALSAKDIVGQVIAGRRYLESRSTRACFSLG